MKSKLNVREMYLLAAKETGIEGPLGPKYKSVGGIDTEPAVWCMRLTCTSSPNKDNLCNEHAHLADEIILECRRVIIEARGAGQMLFGVSDKCTSPMSINANTYKCFVKKWYTLKNWRLPEEVEGQETGRRKPRFGDVVEVSTEGGGWLRVLVEHADAKGFMPYPNEAKWTHLTHDSDNWRWPEKKKQQKGRNLDTTESREFWDNVDKTANKLDDYFYKRRSGLESSAMPIHEPLGSPFHAIPNSRPEPPTECAPAGIHTVPKSPSFTMDDFPDYPAENRGRYDDWHYTRFAVIRERMDNLLSWAKRNFAEYGICKPTGAHLYPEVVYNDGEYRLVLVCPECSK